MGRRARQSGPGAPLALIAASLWLVGCHHKPQAHPPPAAPPTKASSRATPGMATPGVAQPGRPALGSLGGFDTSSIEAELASAPPGFFDDISTPPVFTETGVASWYVTNPRNRRMANGEVGDPVAMTAAHRTAPLGSTLRVTNLSTGQQVLVRVTDRGPFVPGRVLDLSQGAATAIGLYRAGISKVRIDAYAHPGASPDGRWCVQTGAFKTEQDALDLKEALSKRYRGAQVSEFKGATGYWVRIDPARHDKAAALTMLAWIGAPDANSQAYLVRVD